jgi:glucose-1-phosphatase
MQYEAVLFDLGGVIVDIDYQKPLKAFMNLGISGVEHLFLNGGPDSLFYRYERGEVSSGVFFESLRNYAVSAISIDEIQAGWDSILVNLPEHRLDFLNALRQQYPLYLLSNINDSHQLAFRKMVNDVRPGYDFDSLFVKAYYSHELGMRKPEHRAFQHILKTHSIQPEKLLYIDDSEEHINSALELGISAKRIQPGKDELAEICKTIG